MLGVARRLHGLGAVFVVALLCVLTACTAATSTKGAAPSSDAGGDEVAITPAADASDAVSDASVDGPSDDGGDAPIEGSNDGGADASPDDASDANDASDASDASEDTVAPDGAADVVGVSASIVITPSAPSAPAGLTQQLGATLVTADGGTMDVTSLATWSSSDASLASVDASGLVYAYVEGSVTLTATYGGTSGSTTFTITPGVLESIQVFFQVSWPSLDIWCPPLQARAYGNYSNAGTDITSLVTWASSDPSAATISATGLVTAVAPGTTTLSATLQSITGTYVLPVTAPSTTSVAISPNYVSMDAGDTLQLTVTGTFSNGHSCDVTAWSTWQSSAPAVVTVASGGLATGAGAGSATVTGTQGGASSGASFTVRDVTAIGVNPPAAQTDVGVCPAQYQATATYTDGTTRDVTTLAAWASSNPAVATVGANTGLADGVAPGTATMSATLRGVSGSAQLTVGSATPSSLVVAPSTATLGLAEPLQLAATVHMSDGVMCDVTGTSAWQSAAPSVATVSSSGLTTAVAQGSATVGATFGAVSGTSTITVTSATLTSLAIPMSIFTACQGGPPVQLHAIATYSDGSTGDVTTESTWSSSATATATVGASTGIVTGVGVGTATISASFQGQVAMATVQTGCGVITALQVAPSAPSIAVGGTQAFTATVTRSDGSTQDVTSFAMWSSSTDAVAWVSASGVATGVATGSTTVSAIYDGVTGSTTLTVQ